MDRIQYVGFNLVNHGRGNHGYAGLELTECQELCEKTENCRYFNHNKMNDKCFLKYGMGTRKANANFVHGHKYVEIGKRNSLKCILLLLNFLDPTGSLAFTLLVS